MKRTNGVNEYEPAKSKLRKMGNVNGKRKRAPKRWNLKPPWKRKIYHSVKDRLFRFLFENNREALLQLYNALNGTDYTDASMLQVVTIESAVYVVMKNDLAFVFTGTLNLYEHQSTYNPNMPVRFLIYLAEEYQKLVEEAEQSLYGAERIMLPTPQCVVFYNGVKDEPEELGMLLEEFDVDKYERTLRQEGIQIGVQEGIGQGIERSNHLTRILLEQGRTEELERALKDAVYQEQLFCENGL